MMLCQQVQLHEHIHIWYIVCGYKAELWKGDDCCRDNIKNKVAEAEGKTILQALENLWYKVGHLTIQQVRSSNVT